MFGRSGWCLLVAGVVMSGSATEKTVSIRAATAVFLTRKMVSHLGADAVNAPGLLPTFGGDDTQGMKLLTDKGVIALGIELGVGQHAAHRSEGMGLRDEFGEMSTVIPRGLPCRLRQDELPLQVDDGQPFQPMPPRQRLLGVVIHAAYEEGADRALSQPGGIDGHLGTASGPGAASGNGPLRSSIERSQPHPVGAESGRESCNQERNEAAERDAVRSVRPVALRLPGRSSPRSA
jgi:hypothetical protein